jgi:hypothetical protein
MSGSIGYDELRAVTVRQVAQPNAATTPSAMSITVVTAGDAASGLQEAIAV